jgi:uncharacterized protein (DUF1499 family)
MVSMDESYAHWECSTLLGFVDDLELHLRCLGDSGSGEKQQWVIAVRSASRKGWWDLDANRRRIEALRTALVSAGAVLLSMSDGREDLTGAARP